MFSLLAMRDCLGTAEMSTDRSGDNEWTDVGMAGVYRESEHTRILCILTSRTGSIPKESRVSHAACSARYCQDMAQHNVA